MIVNSTVSGNSAATCGGVCGGETVEIGETQSLTRTRRVKHRGHCHFARLQPQQRRWRRSIRLVRAIRSIPIRCSVLCRITAAQPLRTRCCLAAQRLTQAIRTSFHRLSTTSEAVLLDRVFNGRIDIGSFETQPQLPRPHPCLTPAAPDAAKSLVGGGVSRGFLCHGNKSMKPTGPCFRFLSSVRMARFPCFGFSRAIAREATGLDGIIP